MEPLEPQSGAANKEAVWEQADRARNYRLKLLFTGYVPLPVNGKKPVLTDSVSPLPKVSSQMCCALASHRY